jgi:hypothetical protein
MVRKQVRQWAFQGLQGLQGLQESMVEAVVTVGRLGQAGRLVKMEIRGRQERVDWPVFLEVLDLQVRQVHRGLLVLLVAQGQVGQVVAQGQAGRLERVGQVVNLGRLERAVQVVNLGRPGQQVLVEHPKNTRHKQSIQCQFRMSTTLSYWKHWTQG